MLNRTSTAGTRRAAAAHAMYEEGATLEEVGRAFGLSRERVRQIFRDFGLPVCSAKDAHAVHRARQSRQHANRIKDRFRDVRDVDAVAQELQLPKTLVAEVVSGAFSAAERRKSKRAKKSTATRNSSSSCRPPAPR